MRLFSPAKINLFLRILRKREDGYHDLASLFQAISWGDTLTFTLSEHDLLTCTNPTLPCDGRNLVWKAVQLFRRKTGKTFPVHIYLDKQLPMQAGLGGGSSNAATALWGMNQLAGGIATPEELLQWSSEIGSDISFFFSQGTAYCTGRGEIVKPLMPLRYSPKVTLIKPNEGLSTPEVYRHFQLNDRSSYSPEELLDQFYAGNFLCVNDLEPAAFRLLPKLVGLKNKLSEQFSAALLSGSGTSLFALGEEKINSSLLYKKATCTFLTRSSSSWYT